MFSLAPNISNSACNTGLLFVEDSFFWVVCVGLDELTDGEFDIEFVRIGICLGWLFKFVNHGWPVFIISSRVKNLFLFNSLFSHLFFSLLCLFFLFLCYFLSFLSFLEFIFTQFFLALSLLLGIVDLLLCFWLCLLLIFRIHDLQ